MKKKTKKKRPTYRQAMQAVVGIVLTALLVLVIGFGIPACSMLQRVETPNASYVSADRETFLSLAPIVRALADADPANDPDLTGVNGAALLALLDTWDLRLKRAETVLAVSAPAPTPTPAPTPPPGQ